MSQTLKPEEALVSLIKGLPDVSVLVADRVFAQYVPQGASLPCVRYNRVTGTHERHMEGATGLNDLTFQVDIYSQSYSEVKTIGDAIRIGLDGYKGTVQSDNKSLEINGLYLDGDFDDYTPPLGGETIGVRSVIQQWKMTAQEEVGILQS